MSGLKPATAFWEVEAPKVLFNRYGDEAAAMLQSWIRHRKEAVVEAMQDCVVQGIDSQACVAKMEASFMQRFLDHTKAARKQMGVSQSVPMEPMDTGHVHGITWSGWCGQSPSQHHRIPPKDLSILFNGRLIELPYLAGWLLSLGQAS